MLRNDAKEGRVCTFILLICEAAAGFRRRQQLLKRQLKEATESELVLIRTQTTTTTTPTRSYHKVSSALGERVESRLHTGSTRWDHAGASHQQQGFHWTVGV